MTLSSQTPRPRNLRSQARNRRETFWQIYVPLGVAVAVVLGLMALTVFGAGQPARSAWGDVSLIYLICLAAVGGVVQLALLVGLCVGLRAALRGLPPYFKQAQDIMFLVAFRAGEISKKIAGVFIAPRASAAAAQKTLDTARSIVKVKLNAGRKG